MYLQPCVYSGQDSDDEYDGWSFARKIADHLAHPEKEEILRLIHRSDELERKNAALENELEFARATIKALNLGGSEYLAEKVVKLQKELEVGPMVSFRRGYDAGEADAPAWLRYSRDHSFKYGWDDALRVLKVPKNNELWHWHQPRDASFQLPTWRGGRVVYEAVGGRVERTGIRGLRNP